MAENVAYIDSVEHRSAVYSGAFPDALRPWAKRDFLEWLERHNALLRQQAFMEGYGVGFKLGYDEGYSDAADWYE